MTDHREQSAETVLEVDAVTKVYPTEPPVHALRGVSLAVRRGDLVAVVGPSGSGKTTLLHLMGTLDRPSTGTVRLTGLDVAAMTDPQLATVRATRIGFIFQQFFLSEHSTVIDNVAEGLFYAGIGRAERRRRAGQALERVGLGARLDARPTQLSGGQRQRVAIARALVGQPAIVLADEPTGNLDSATGQSILALIEELHREGTTILLITHDQDIAARLPRRVEILDGHIVADSAEGYVGGSHDVAPITAPLAAAAGPATGSADQAATGGGSAAQPTGSAGEPVAVPEQAR